VWFLKRLRDLIFGSTKSASERLLLELSNVRKIVCQEASFFKNPVIDEGAKRKRLNLLFVKDLLDGVNGMILDHKDRRDNERRSQVEGWKKMSASLFLVSVSGGMLFYIYLFAMRQSRSRQQAWFSSFQVWLFFEIFISSTGLVLVEHVLIPLWSMKDLRRVKDKMVSDVLIFQRRLKYSTDRQGQGAANLVGLRRPMEAGADDSLSFNAAEYLYPSYRLARLFPTYPESELILQYKTPWPKKSLQHEVKSVKRNYDKRFDFFAQTVSRVLVLSLASMIHLPQPLQDSGVQIFLIGFFGYLIRLHVRLFRLSPFLVVLPAFVVIVIVHLLTLSSRNAERVRFLKTHPLADSEEPEEEPLPLSPTLVQTQAQAGESKNDDHSPSLSDLHSPPNTTSPPSPLDRTSLSLAPLVVSTPSLLDLTSPPPSAPVNEPGLIDEASESLIWESSDEDEGGEGGEEGDIYEISDESDSSALRDETRAASLDEENSSDRSQEFSDSDSSSLS
jgi:hypothetical protein